jgi:hypothetical protein
MLKPFDAPRIRVYVVGGQCRTGRITDFPLTLNRIKIIVLKPRHNSAHCLTPSQTFDHYAWIFMRNIGKRY